jgi:L-threonylcarbamoyladenylate synthase
VPFPLPPGSIVPADAAGIAAAADILRAGGLVGLPTETVYGLAADARNGLAVASVYEAKGRPQFNPLISHVEDLTAARRHGVFNRDAAMLAEAFWPGPLTLVVPLRPDCPISPLALAGLDTVALRVPGNPAARALIAAFGGPVAAPSANLSGRVSPTTARHVQVDLGAKVGLILDDGPCDIGLESTVVRCTSGSAVILRPGGLSRESVAGILRQTVSAIHPEDHRTLQSPGMLLSHYAPIAKLQLNVIKPGSHDAILAFGQCDERQFSAQQPFLNLSPQGDLRQAAANLFSALRILDELSPPIISVLPIPRTGLGEAINDRLEKAAAPRPSPESS